MAKVEYKSELREFHRRSITKSDWKNLGVDHPDVWFTADNNWTVEGDFPPEVVNYFRGDSDFKVNEDKEKSTQTTKEKS